MTRRGRNLTVLTVAGVGALPGVAVADPAVADLAVADPAVCEPGEMCFWSGIFDGAFDQMSGGLADDADLGNNTYDTDPSRTLGNTVSSVRNRTGDTYVALYRETSYRQFWGCVGPGVQINLANAGVGDDIESIRIANSTNYKRLCDDGVW